jgi:small GTP-binding protein
MNKSEMTEEESNIKNQETKQVANDSKGIEILSGSKSEGIKIVKRGNENSSLNISYEFLFKVSLIGDSGTGKTSIITRFIDNVFKSETSTTIGVDFKIVSFDLGNETYAKMQIWDTCGSERFKSLTASFLKTCSAFILVFDLTRLSTFQSIDNWIKTIKENTKPKFLILIGNKSDLKEERTVDKEKIYKYCEKNKFNYIETSVKNNSNIEKIFKEVAYQLYSGIKGKDNKKGDLKEYEIGGFKNIKIDDNKDNNSNNNEKKNLCCR